MSQSNTRPITSPQPPSRVGVRRPRLSQETWARILEEYLAGATARELQLRYGVAVQSIYARMNGRGKKRRRKEIGDLDSGIGDQEGALLPLDGGGGRAAAGGGAGAERDECALEAAANEDSASRDPSSSAAPTPPQSPLRGDSSPIEGERGALIEGGASVAAFLANTKGIRVRRTHAPVVWRQMRRDYEEGGFTAPVIANWYGATHHAVKRRARVEGWSKLVRAPAPEPLYPYPNEDEAAKCGEGFVSRWREIAHAAQLPPAGTWATWLFQGGRGAGKTRAGAEWLAERAERAPGIFALVGPTQHDVREVMIDGVSGLRELPGRVRPHYERSRRRLLWDNGAMAYAFSAEEPERLRGPQFEAAWADEFCIWPRPSETLAILRMGLRRGERPQLVVTTTPKPIPALRALRAEPSCVVTQAPTRVNAAHLSPSFLDGLNTLYGGTRLAAQELDGIMLEGDGALWKLADIERARGGVAPKCERVAVGVDPPAGGGVCGIVVAGRVGERFYVLADRSAPGLSPLAWASRVAEAAREFGATEIVAEANQGGEMVRATLAQAGSPCSVRLVHAAHGKRVRAEPIALLYEQGRVSHCGPFAALEEQLLALGVAESEGLLDRADALVWALTALVGAGQGPRIRTFDVGPPRRGLSAW